MTVFDERRLRWSKETFCRYLRAYGYKYVQSPALFAANLNSRGCCSIDLLPRNVTNSAFSPICAADHCEKNENSSLELETVFASPSKICPSKRHTSLSWPSSGPDFRVVWLLKLPASGWESLWELSSYVPWFVLNSFRDVSGAIPE